MLAKKCRSSIADRMNQVYALQTINALFFVSLYIAGSQRLCR